MSVLIHDVLIPDDDSTTSASVQLKGDRIYELILRLIQLLYPMIAILMDVISYFYQDLLMLTRTPLRCGNED
ncbi:hypothetical protein [Gloeocapsopsis crepidinum]|uniref:hypothetical protein n=1 Tax=Gloeocapsopsis crepidinum TaxID=693223 RepID=UPI001D1523D8|nr:hypothetical protein [Gloeocapsopsis crepidinum]